MRKITMPDALTENARRRKVTDLAYSKRRFHPTINRWTGKPHDHAREIARRARQTERRA